MQRAFRIGKAFVAVERCRVGVFLWLFRVWCCLGRFETKRQKAIEPTLLDRWFCCGVSVDLVLCSWLALSL